MAAILSCASPEPENTPDELVTDKSVVEELQGVEPVPTPTDSYSVKPKRKKSFHGSKGFVHKKRRHH